MIWEWALWVTVALAVYAVGLVVTFLLCVRFCEYHKQGHVRPSGSVCDHWEVAGPVPWLWPLAVFLAVLAAPFILPVMGTYQVCKRGEARLVARHRSG